MLRNIILTVIFLSLDLVIRRSYPVAQTATPDSMELAEITRENISRIQELTSLKMNGKIEAIAWSPTANELAIAVDNSVWIYVIQPSASISEHFQTDHNVSSLEYIPNSPYLAIDNSVYKIPDFRPAYTLPASIYALSTNGKYASVVKGKIVIFDYSGQALSTFSPILPSGCDYYCNISDLEFSSDGQYLAFSSANPELYSGRIDTSDGSFLVPIEVGYAGLSAQPLGHVIASRIGQPGYLSQAILFSDIETGVAKARLNIYGEYSKPIFNKDGSLVAISIIDNMAPNIDEATNSIAFFDMEQVLKNKSLASSAAIYTDPVEQKITDIAYSSDFRFLAVATSSGTIHILDIPEE